MNKEDKTYLKSLSDEELNKLLTSFRSWKRHSWLKKCRKVISREQNKRERLGSPRIKE